MGPAGRKLLTRESLLLFSPPREARDYRLGPSQLSLRGQSGGYAPQARIRPLLHPPFLLHARCRDHPENDPHHAVWQRSLNVLSFGPRIPSGVRGLFFIVKPYDFLVLGGGSAGFNAARVAVSLGLRTAIVDGARDLGGLCILRGCMPSKTLLYMADVLHLAQKGKTFGLKIPSARANMRAIHARKKRIIAEFAGSRVQALKHGKFELIRAHARFVDPHTVKLSDGRQLRASYFLLGTGSKVSVPPVPGLAGASFWTSDDVLELDFIPKSVVVLGGGIVACELSQFLNRIGAKVTLIQRSRNILRDHSEDASTVVQQSFVDEGIELFAGTRIEQITQDRRGTAVTFIHDGKRLVR